MITPHFLRRTWAVLKLVVSRFYLDDGWAIASHIALQSFVSMFPFAIILTVIGTLFQNREATDQMIVLLFQLLPERLAAPLVGEMERVLEGTGSNLLTFSIVVALYLSSSGVEGLRVGLNRAYGVTDVRSWLFCRLQSVLFVIIGAIALLTMGLLIVFWPLAMQTIERFIPDIGADFISSIAKLDYWRYFITVSILSAALIISHTWLPAGKRRINDIWMGILLTMVLWLVTASVFGYYMGYFFDNYAATYAGLAVLMATMLFLYLGASIFILGGNFNAALIATRHML